MTDYVLAGLVKRRAELAGEADALRERLARLGADLAALDAAIRVFDPAYPLAAIRPRRPRGGRPRGAGQTVRAALNALRAAPGPLSAADVALRALAARGADPTDPGGLEREARLVGKALARQRANGTVRSTPGPGQCVLWEVARE